MKKNMFHLLSFITFWGMGLTGGTSAQAVTLDDILQDVVVTHPAILEKQKAYNAALADLKNTKGAYFPKVIFTGNVGYKLYRDSGTRYKTDDDGFYDARLTISQLLFDGGKTASLASARKNYMLAALYAYVGKASQVTYDTILAYLNVLKYNELQALAMQNVLIHESLLERIQMQVDRGKKGRSELERINGRMAAAQSRLILRQNDYKKAVLALHKMLGRFTPIEEMVMPRMDVGELPSTLKAALDLQVQFHPLLREAFYNIAQKRAEYESKRSEYMGRLSLEGVASIENEFTPSNDYETEASIGLRYRHTLFDSGRPHRVQAAASKVHQEQQKGYRVRRTLLNDIQLSWAAHKLLTEQIGVLKKNLYFTNRSLETYKKEFALGRRNLINILDAQNEHQYVNEQLINAQYSRELEKYKVLLSEGVLLSRLGLLSSQAQALIQGDDTYVPLSNDTLPLTHDFDQDSVLDRVDVSMNNRPGTAVNQFGVNEKYDMAYAFETTLPSSDQKETRIGPDDSLAQHPIQMDTVTRFDFNAFLPGSKGLTQPMTRKMMKDLVKQARRYISQTPLYITVSTNEYDDADANYNLALERAYTLKRILQYNDVDSQGIFVFADTNAPKGHNILRLKFTDNLFDFQRQYSPHSVTEDLFVQQKNQLIHSQTLDKLATVISNHPGKVEILLYSNELPNVEDNRQLDLKRAVLLRDKLVQKGVNPNQLTLFPWGSFKKDPLLPESRQINQYLQYVLR